MENTIDRTSLDPNDQSVHSLTPLGYSRRMDIMGTEEAILPEASPFSESIGNSDLTTPNFDPGADFLNQLETLEKRTSQQQQRLKRQKLANANLSALIRQKELETQLRNVRICELKADISKLEHSIAAHELQEMARHGDEFSNTACPIIPFSSTDPPHPSVLCALSSLKSGPSQSADPKRLLDLRGRIEQYELQTARLNTLRNTLLAHEPQFVEFIQHIKERHPMRAKLQETERQAEEWTTKQKEVDPTGDIMAHCTLGLNTAGCSSEDALPAYVLDPELRELEAMAERLQDEHSTLQLQIDKLTSKLQTQVNDRLAATAKLNRDKDLNSQKLRERAQLLERLERQLHELEADQ